MIDSALEGRISLKRCADPLFASALASILLAGSLGFPVLVSLFHAWRSDESLSHGPVVLVLSLGLLWTRRENLKKGERETVVGGACLVLFSLLHVMAYFADIVFLKALSLIGLSLSAIWFFQGASALRAAAGPLGLLLFALPWPTTLVEKIAFPLQLASSSYAALIGGLMGLPILREGVHLSVMSPGGDKLIYGVLVAQGCSGLRSLTALLALSYLIAYFTPVAMRWRIAMIAACIPFALLANAIRLSIVLFIGARYNPHLAQWVHDHESPVLIFICSLGLMGLRSGLMSWASDDKKSSQPRPIQKPIHEGTIKRARRTRPEITESDFFEARDDESLNS